MCTILVEASAVFTICLGLHVATWRIRRPITYVQWLPLLAAIFLVAGPAVAWLIVQRAVLAVDVVRGDPATEWAAVVLLHGSVSAVYVIGYTLVSAFSPSLELLKLLERAPRGLARSELDLPFLRSAVGGDRVANLVAGGLIRADLDGVSLGPRARALTGLVLFYRHAIGLPDGAGG